MRPIVTLAFWIGYPAFAVDQDRIHQPIEQLGSEDFEVREKAIRPLMEHQDALSV
jgi:hypothetical protein